MPRPRNKTSNHTPTFALPRQIAWLLCFSAWAVIYHLQWGFLVNAKHAQQHLSTPSASAINTQTLNQIQNNAGEILADLYPKDSWPTPAYQQAARDLLTTQNTHLSQSYQPLKPTTFTNSISHLLTQLPVATFNTPWTQQAYPKATVLLLENQAALNTFAAAGFESDLFWPCLQINGEIPQAKTLLTSLPKPELAIIDQSCKLILADLYRCLGQHQFEQAWFYATSLQAWSVKINQTIAHPIDFLASAKRSQYAEQAFIACLENIPFKRLSSLATSKLTSEVTTENSPTIASNSLAANHLKFITQNQSFIQTLQEKAHSPRPWPSHQKRLENLRSADLLIAWQAVCEGDMPYEYLDHQAYEIIQAWTESQNDLPIHSKTLKQIPYFRSAQTQQRLRQHLKQTQLNLTTKLPSWPAFQQALQAAQAQHQLIIDHFFTPPPTTTTTTQPPEDPVAKAILVLLGLNPNPSIQEIQMAADWFYITRTHIDINLYRSLYKQTARQQFWPVAWALSEYRHDHQVLPKTLDELVPQYLPTIPLDPFDLKPMRYEKKSNQFNLWMVGLDEINQSTHKPNPFKNLVWTTTFKN